MTPRQLQNLKIYLKFRGQKMTAFKLFKTNVRLYMIMFLALGAVAAYWYFALGPHAAAIIGIVAAVVVLRDYSYFRQSSAMWPVLQDVIDWSKVENLVSSSDKPVA